MNTEYLRYLLAIGEHKSISKAAKELFISQSALSRVLQNTEKDIGITIFHRTNKGVEITYEGEKFLNRAKSMIAELDKFENDYFQSLFPQSEGNTLIVGAHRTTPAVEAFIEYYNYRCTQAQNLNLVFNEEPLDDIIEQVAYGTIDLGIIDYVSGKEDEILRKLQEYNLTCVIVSDSPFCIQVRKGHPLAEKAGVDLSELEPYVHVCFSDENFTGINYCVNADKYNWELDRKRVVTNSRGVLRSFIINTDSYYIGNNAKCRLLASQSTICIPVNHYPYTIKSAYVHHKNRVLTEDERVYLSFLTKIYRNADESLKEEYDRAKP